MTVRRDHQTVKVQVRRRGLHVRRLHIQRRAWNSIPTGRSVHGMGGIWKLVLQLQNQQVALSNP
jgi:hypothetical protein